MLLVVFFAAYLVEKRELLASGSRRIGRMYLPDPKHLGPLLLPWVVSILIMVQQKDLGSSLLFFAVFVAMLYIATDRSAYLVAGVGACSALAVVIAYQAFGHVQSRIDTWLDPWNDPQNEGYQLVQSLYAFGSGGFQGTGLGLGRPDVIPVATTDFIFAAIGEELGLLGTVGGGHRVHAARRQRVPHRGAGAAAVLEAVRRRPRDDPRRADVRHHRRRHPRDPAHRRHAAVRVVRRLVARRQLRDPRAAAAHLRRERGRRGGRGRAARPAGLAVEAARP